MAMVESGQQGPARFVNIGSWMGWSSSPVKWPIPHQQYHTMSPKSAVGSAGGMRDHRVRARRPVDQRFRRRPCRTIISIPEPCCRPSRSSQLQTALGDLSSAISLAVSLREEASTSGLLAWLLRVYPENIHSGSATSVAVALLASGSESGGRRRRQGVEPT